MGIAFLLHTVLVAGNLFERRINTADLQCVFFGIMQQRTEEGRRGAAAPHEARNDETEPCNRKARGGLTKRDNDDKFGKGVSFSSPLVIIFNMLIRSIRSRSTILRVPSYECKLLPLAFTIRKMTCSKAKQSKSKTQPYFIRLL
jgi:hypothetical protein